VVLSGEAEDSGIQANYSAAPKPSLLPATAGGKAAAGRTVVNPLFTLYPENGANHQKEIRITKIKFISENVVSSKVT